MRALPRPVEMHWLSLDSTKKCLKNLEDFSLPGQPFVQAASLDFNAVLWKEYAEH